VIRHPGGIAFVVRRASGVALTVYFVAWVARLHEHPLVPFGGDLGRTGSALGKVAEVGLIVLLAAHALEGLSQVAVERLHLARRRTFLVVSALLVGVVAGLVHLPWFFRGVVSP
jgi:succinate dehydrogenase hydrophobic anchor subunit